MAIIKMFIEMKGKVERMDLKLVFLVFSSQKMHFYKSFVPFEHYMNKSITINILFCGCFVYKRVP